MKESWRFHQSKANNSQAAPNPSSPGGGWLAEGERGRGGGAAGAATPRSSGGETPRSAGGGGDESEESAQAQEEEDAPHLNVALQKELKRCA